MKKERRDARFSEVRVALGKRLRQHRVERRFTQGQIAKELEVTQPRVSEWERGEAFPSIPYVLTFCQYVGVGLERLFEGLARFDHGQLPLEGLETDDRRAVEHIVAKLIVISGTAGPSPSKAASDSGAQAREERPAS
jgi:transcriptional regulator with XRE-family HTH domain